MWPFKKKELRQAGEPHIEVQNNACVHVRESIGGILNAVFANKYDAMSQSPFFAAVNLISNGIAQMGWEVKSKTDKQPTNSDYIDSLFNDTNLTKFMFVKNIIRDVLIHGDGFAYIHRDKSGVPVSLEYAPWGDTAIEYNPLTRVLFYRMPKIKEGLIEPIDVIHLLMNSNDGIFGRSVIDYAYNTVKLSGHAEKSAEEFFASGCIVQGILSTEQPILTPDTIRDIKEQWKSSQLGDGSGVAVLEAGMKYQNVSSNAKDAQLIETRQFNITEVARWFNISPVLLGDYSKTAYNTIEQAQLQFVVNTLAPYVIEMEEELNRKLIMPSDRKKFYIDIVEEDIIAQDKKAQAEYLGIYLDKAAMTTNEVRAKLGLPPVEGGDELYRPYTDISQNKIGGDKPEDKNTDENTDEEES